MHGSGLRYAAQVVAQEIDDHDIFAAVFGVVAQPLGDCSVLSRGAAARSRAFHGTGDDAPGCPALLDAEKQLRREGLDESPLLPMKERPVIDRLASAQLRVERCHAAVGLDMKWRCEIELVHIAGADQLVDGGNALCVFGFCESKLGFNLRSGRSSFDRVRAGTAKLPKFRRLSVDEFSSRVVEGVTALVNSKPGQQLTIAAGAHSGFRLKSVAALVAKKPC